ncbi:SDR family NAD(P)-dependent oxidoreductase [Martelella soudanensis]|uniref:SDR family NAD(P)-dependent oxidoreductase n=1 Tax=unclassified Martelella TaxID=2629616 RepID=UPI0015DD60E9|nr:MULTISPECIES: SDR family oxidoreductase [unclassified Martelella]
MNSAILTGAGGGIGREILQTLVAKGISVLATDLSESALASAADELKDLPGKIICSAGNITDPDFAVALTARALDAFGGISLLINCSGFLKDARFQKMSDDLFRTLIAVNLIGPIRLIEAVTPYMKQEGRGRIISLASRAWLGNFGSSGYSAAKGGIVGYSRALALALAPHGITVNCVAPGFIDTPMARSLPPEIMQRVLEAIPVGRAGTVQDVSALVAFLASDESGYITGQTLVACGGRSISDPISAK